MLRISIWMLTALAVVILVALTRSGWDFEGPSLSGAEAEDGNRLESVSQDSKLKGAKVSEGLGRTVLGSSPGWRIQLQLTDESGQPIRGVRVTGATVQRGDGSAFGRAVSQPLPIEPSLWQRESDSNGVVNAELPASKAQDQQVIWFAKPGYLVKGIKVKVKASEPVHRIVVPLQKWEATVVRVEYGDGSPAVGAQVTSFGRVSSSLTSSDDVGCYAASYRYELDADDAGIALVPATGFLTEFRAVSGSLVSQPVVAQGPKKVVLQVDRGIQVSGSLLHLEHLEGLGKAFVNVKVRGSLLTRIPLLPSGHFGPVNVALKEGDVVDFACEIGRDQMYYATALHTGAESIEVTLRPVPTNVLWLAGVSVDGSIPASMLFSVVKAAETGDIPIGVYAPNDDGIVCIEGLRAGHYVALVSAPGFADKTSKFIVPEMDPVLHEMVLDHGGKLQVSVDGNEDLSRALVEVHPEDFGASPVVRSLAGDGSEQVIGGVPLGWVNVFARSMNEWATAPIRVFVGPNEVKSVRLVKQGSCEIHGLIQSDTQAGVQDALMIHERNGVPIARAKSGPLGQFRMESSQLAQGDKLVVSALGFAKAVIELDAGGQSPHLLGAIVLSRQVDLYVELVADQHLDITSYWVWLSGQEDRAVRFDFDGFAQIKELDPGPVAVLLGTSTDSARECNTVLGMGENLLRFDLRRSSPVTVTLQQVRDFGLHQGCFVEAIAVDSEASPNVRDSYHVWSEGFETVVLDSVAEGQYQIRAELPNGVTLGSTLLTVAPGASNRTTVRLGSRGREVRIERSPETEATRVELVLIDTLGMRSRQFTDEYGVVWAHFPGEGPWLAYLLAEDGCAEWGIEVERSVLDKAGQVRLYFDPSARIELQLFNTEGPLSGYQCALYGKGLVRPVSNIGITNDEGFVRFDCVSPGAYQFRAFIPNHWPYVQDRMAAIDGGLQRVWVPRVADLRIVVRSEAGRTLAGRRVKVWSLDFEKDISAWQQAGVMDVIPADWVTDQEGVLKIPRIAEGKYVCSAANEDGEWVDVSIEVLPGAGNLAVLELDK